jgi:hypothetical protein
MNNLERFWVATAPCVRVEAGCDAAFRLRELWCAPLRAPAAWPGLAGAEARPRRDSLEEWSAYGVSVPLLLDGNQEARRFSRFLSSPASKALRKG